MIRKSTWIVLLIFMSVLAVLIWFERTSQDQAIEMLPTSASIKFLNVQEQELVGLTIQSMDGKYYELERPVQGEWSFVKPEPAQADTAALQSALSQFLASQVISSPASLPGLDALNLENALYKVLLLSQDGSKIVINVGKETPTGSGYYVLASNQNQVVVVNKYGLDALLSLLETPPYLPTPTLETDVTSGVEETPAP